MKKKITVTVLTVIGISVLIWVAMFITDYIRASSLKPPLFATAALTADDGGSGTYRGIGYRVEVKMHLDAEYGATVESVEMSVFGKTVAASITDLEPVYDWGITLTAKDVTPFGLTVVCTQSGGNITGELQTGSMYWIEKKDKDVWKKAEYIMEEPVCWNSIAYLITANGKTEWTVNWERLYGELPAGEYRIGKQIADFREANGYDTQNCYAEFTVWE